MDDDEYNPHTLKWSAKPPRRVVHAQRSEELQFNFGETLGDLRLKLQDERDKEQRLLDEMRREMAAVVGNTGTSELVSSFDRAVARLYGCASGTQTEGQQLSESLKKVSSQAQYISQRVATLDQAKGRVVECLQLVNDLLDLRTCAEGVQTAMASEDYDEAAQHIHRFLTLDSAVFRLGEQVGGRDAGQTMKHSYEILRKATAQLKTVIERKFDEAHTQNNEAEMHRYFKYFPMINEHAAGLERFGRYLNSKIEKSGDEYFRVMQAGGTDDKRANVLYADTLTMLLEGIARLVEIHQSLIDNFYGPDKLLNLIEMLQVEADRQAERILAAFVQKRQIDVLARQVDTIMRDAKGAGTSALADKVAVRDLDVVLSEVTLMHTRCALYWRFLRRRLGETPAQPLKSPGDEHAPLSPKASVASSPSAASGANSPTVADAEVFAFEEQNEEERARAAAHAAELRKARNQKLDALLNRSVLSTRMQELLGKYVLVEQFYMLESARKAIEMDEVEDGALTSSLLDDTFFLVRKSIRRSITSSSVDCVCAMLNHGCTLLETDYFTHINKMIKAGYPSVGLAAEAYQTAHIAYSVLQHGKSVAEAGPETQRAAFLIALNNMRVSVENIAKLRSGLSDEFARHLAHLSTSDQGKLEHSTAQMDDLCRKFAHSVTIGLQKLVDSAFRSKLKHSAETYLELDHELNDAQYAEAEQLNTFMGGFIEQLDKLIAGFNDVLVTDNYKEFLHLVAAEATKQLEAVVMQCDFNRLGALQLDRELRELTAYLTTIADWSIRARASRLTQLISLMNTANVDEAHELFCGLQGGGANALAGSGGGASALLTLSDLKRALKRRVDLSADRINALRA